MASSRPDHRPGRAGPNGAQLAASGPVFFNRAAAAAAARPSVNCPVVKDCRYRSAGESSYVPPICLPRRVPQLHAAADFRFPFQFSSVAATARRRHSP